MAKPFPAVAKAQGTRRDERLHRLYSHLYRNVVSLCLKARATGFSFSHIEACRYHLDSKEGGKDLWKAKESSEVLLLEKDGKAVLLM